MKLPAVWIALVFSAGVLLASLFSFSALAWFLLASIVILAGFVLAQRRELIAAWICALLGWAALGGAAARIERLPLPVNHVARLVAEGRLDTSEPLRWRGRLRYDPLRLPWGMRYEINLDEVVAAGRAIPVTGGLRVSYYRNAKNPEDQPAVRAGDRVEALVRARAPRNFLDPGAFDARGFLARQGIHLTSSLRSTELLLSIPSLYLIIALRFQDGRTVVEIARLMRLDQKGLYRRLGRVMKGLRTALEVGGIDAVAMIEMFESPAVSIDWRCDTEETSKVRPSIAKGEPEWR